MLNCELGTFLYLFAASEGSFTAAPWVSAKGKGTFDRSEPSLLDIQQEEERQMIAEMKQKQQMRGASWKDTSEMVRAGVWGSASQKLTWRQNSQVDFSLKHFT